MSDVWPKAMISQSVVLELTATGWTVSGPQSRSVFLNFDEAEAISRIVLNLSRLRSVDLDTVAETGNGAGGIPAPPVQPLSYQTVAQRVAEQIRSAILNGLYPAGARLDEVSLAKAHGVSRTPIREALGQLASAGVVLYEPRKGCRVA